MPSEPLQAVGMLYTPEPITLSLELGRPLSHLLAQRGDAVIPAARAIAEARGDHLRRRIAVLLDRSPEETIDVLQERLESPVFPVLGQNLAFFDPGQVAALGMGLVEAEGQHEEIAGLELRPIYELDPRVSLDLGSARQFWRSEWTYADHREDDPDWWRVWPQGERPEIHGEFVAMVSLWQWASLKWPTYVVIENPSDPSMRLHALVKHDPEGTQLNDDALKERQIVALDASCRDALGILDGEFCRLVVWPGRHGRHNAKRHLVGARTIVAHTKIAARVDLEKPVCRLGTDALVAIGARPEDIVVIESVVQTGPRTYEAREIKLRALPIDEAEAEGRATWERNRGTDGWVDPAAVHGIHPPYPAIYLDRLAREKLGIPIAAPVIVRTSVAARLGSEASDFLWIAVGGVVVAALTAGHVSAWIAVGVTGFAAAFFAVLRIRRAVR